MSFEFRDLFIYDMANNHQGSLEHGLLIIDEAAKVSNEEKVRGAFKFQFRDLDTFIHKGYRKSDISKHIPRFLSTELKKRDFLKMTNRVRENGLLTIATPFDELSVDMIDDFGIEIIKIASCSATDFPLLERVSKSEKPVALSTGGLNIKQIDMVVNFLESRKVDFSIMHCVPLYPTKIEDLQLNQIGVFCSRYPNHVIGFSTHEEPTNLSAIQIAYAKGARIFERHVGMETDKITLNDYSSRPEQLQKWIQSWKEVVISSGSERRPPASRSTKESLQSLKRGVYAKAKIQKGDELKKNKVFFAMPLLDGGLESGSWFGHLIADKDYNRNEPVSNRLALQKTKSTRKEIIDEVISQVKGMLNDAKISINKESTIELSHHYGMERFREYGAIIVNCVITPRYCKKLVIQLPSQNHPYHYHDKKQETFQLLWGDMELEINGDIHNMKPGDIFHINAYDWHKFKTTHGAIFEEVSTNGDSFYEDDKIRLLGREERKTFLINTGENNFTYEEGKE